jgi:hypothetical protein
MQISNGFKMLENALVVIAQKAPERGVNCFYIRNRGQHTTNSAAILLRVSVIQLISATLAGFPLYA